MKKNKIYLGLIGAILFFGLIFRILRINEQLIFFYDQALTSQKIYEIVSRHDMKLVGMPTDLPGVFSGPFLFYLLAPVYYFTHFNVTAVAIFCVLVNLASGVLLFDFCRVLFKNKKIGLLALFFWVLSFAQMNYSKLIGIYSFVPFFVAMFYLGLAKFIFQKKEGGLVLSAAGYALAFQLNPYLIYLGIFYPILYFIYHPKINLRIIMLSLAAFMALSINYYVAEIKWNFLGTKSMFKYLTSQTETGAVLNNLFAYVQKLSESIYYSFFSFNIFLALIFFVLLLVYVFKTYKLRKEIIFLYVWIFSTLPLFAFKTGAVGSLEINLSIFPALTIFFAISAYLFLSDKKLLPVGILFVLLVVLSNFSLSAKDKFGNTALFAYQPLYLQNELGVINYTYTVSQDHPFSVCSVSAPLFVNTLWSYLYSTYGKTHFGFVPFWSGPKQEGTGNQMPYDVSHAPVRFLIIEPHKSIPDSAIKATIFSEDNVSVLAEEKMFGNIRVQKRILAADPRRLKDTQQLSEADKSFLETYILARDNRYSCYHVY